MGRFSIVKIPVLPNLIYGFNAIQIKIPASYFMSIDRLILKFMQRGKRLTIVHTVLKEKNKVGGMILPNFKTY